jgi:hypothetical protein
MSNQRKQIIINEIAFWKKNKMLPEHYCDFLTSLYTEGQSEKAPLIADAKQSIIVKEKKQMQRKFFLYPIIALLALIGLNYLPFDWLAIAIGIVLGIVFAIYGIKLAVKKHVAAPILHVSSALLLLVMSVKLATTYFAESNVAIYTVLSINSLLWVALGIWQRLIYFILAGGLGLAVVAGFLMFY